MSNWSAPSSSNISVYSDGSYSAMGMEGLLLYGDDPQLFRTHPLHRADAERLFPCFIYNPKILRLSCSASSAYIYRPDRLSHTCKAQEKRDIPLSAEAFHYLSAFYNTTLCPCLEDDHS